ncbi:hypothetical protein NSP_46830 [Nodularia spumigena CCY9414]|nr:hypothetical protein NSP_46830 [Nodularia spumigena CCY9414]
MSHKDICKTQNTKPAIRRCAKLPNFCLSPVIFSLWVDYRIHFGEWVKQF